MSISTGIIVSGTRDDAFSNHNMILELFYLREMLYGQIGLVRID